MQHFVVQISTFTSHSYSYDSIWCYINLKNILREKAETVLLDRVPIATYACYYLALSSFEEKVSPHKNSAHTDIGIYTLPCKHGYRIHSE